jgi:hypothetical protein
MVLSSWLQSRLSCQTLLRKALKAVRTQELRAINVDKGIELTWDISISLLDVPEVAQI